MVHEKNEDTLSEAIGALRAQDVGPSRSEGIRRQCRAVLHRRRRPRSAPGPRLVARVLEPALATTLAVFYLLGMLERTLLLLGG